MMKIAVLTGAGISAESGIPVFRGAGGLWEGYRLEDVATPDAWARDPEMVLRFYNERRQAVARALPNAAHVALAELEVRHEVTVITQNIDDLHERAASSKVIHLHGEIMKARGTCGANKIFPWGARDILMGDCCPEGSQLRPHVVWFGEDVPEYERAIPLIRQADLVMVIGTSLQVYPAAGLIEFVSSGVPVYVIDPASPLVGGDSMPEVIHFAEPATQAVPRIVNELLERA